MQANTQNLTNDAAARVNGAPPAYVPPVSAPGAGPVPRKGGLSPLVWVLLVLGMLVLFCSAGFIALTAWVTTTAVKVAGDIPAVVVGPTQTDTSAVPLDGAQAADVTLNMGAGKLTLAGGATNLLDGTFTYNVDAWKPVVTYQTTTGTGILTVKQAGANGFARTPDNTRNDWDLRLKDGVPLALTANMGAGESRLTLGGLNLSKLDVHTGAGEATVDLSGTWKQNLTATIQAGVGETTVTLPRDVGVRVTAAQSGLGKVHANGLIASGDSYTNAVYGHSPVTLELTVQVGVGEITLEQAK